jgi:predicted enzyme related to lactoylglutathione lyase
MSRQLDTVLCEVRSLPEAVAFYTAIFGAEPTVHGLNWASFDLGGVSVGLHTPYSDVAKAGSGGWVLGVRVESLDAVRTTLAEFGRAVEQTHDIPGGRLIEFSDIDGNRIQAIERP